MQNVLKKEFRLAAPWGIWLITLLAILVAVPQYPMIVSVGYVFMAIFLCFSTYRDNRDLEFSAILPISRETIVKGKIAFVAALESVQIILAVPFAVLTDTLISPAGNPVGLDPNLAFFGVALISVSAFNLIMPPLFFRTGYKLALPMLLGLAAFVLTYLAFELPIQLVPALHATLDSLDPVTFGYQSILLLGGIVVYFVTLYAACALSVRNFQKVSI